MSAPVNVTDERVSEWSPMRERMWWLPRRGIGNGLDATGWAPILDVDPARVDELLEALGRCAIAAFAGAAATGSGAVTLWVATERWSAAEDLLMERLRGPHRRGAGRDR